MLLASSDMDYRELPDAALRQLWLDYADNPDQDNRDRIVSVYAGFARMLAAKLYSKRFVKEIEFDEYLHYALLGLLESIDRYDPKQGASFQTFASARINGSILNGIETYSEHQQQIALKARVRRERTQSIISSEGKQAQRTSFEELAEIAVGLAIGYMLEGSGMYHDDNSAQSKTGYERVEYKELCEIMSRLVDFLPDQQKRVIKYHYFFARGFDEIGALMGLTKGRISQIHKQALLELKSLYRRYGELDRSL